MATGIRLTRIDQNYIMARFMEGQSPACAAMDYFRLNYPLAAKRIDAGHGLEWHRMGLRAIRAIAKRLGWTEAFILDDLQSKMKPGETVPLWIRGERATRKR